MASKSTCALALLRRSLRDGLLPSHRFGKWICVFALLALVAGSRPAHAEPTPADRETARTLMDQGDASFDQKNYADALKDYQGAHAIMNVPTTGYAVAQTLAALGRLIEAIDAAILVTQMPVAKGESRPFTVARAQAQKLANELAPRIATLKVDIKGPSDTAAVKVEIDGTSVPNAVLTLPRNVNPGAHLVHASAAGYSDDERTVTVAPGEIIAIELVLKPKPASEPPPIVRAAPAETNLNASGPAAPPTGMTESDTGTAAKDGASPFWGTQRIVATAVAGVGVVAMGAGAAIGLSAKSKYDSVAGRCTDLGCDDGAYQTRQDARSQGNVATIVVGVGAAALAGSVVLWLSAPHAQLAPSIAVGPSSVIARMSF